MWAKFCLSPNYKNVLVNLDLNLFMVTFLFTKEVYWINILHAKHFALMMMELSRGMRRSLKKCNTLRTHLASHAGIHRVCHAILPHELLDERVTIPKKACMGG